MRWAGPALALPVHVRAAAVRAGVRVEGLSFEGTSQRARV